MAAHPVTLRTSGDVWTNESGRGPTCACASPATPWNPCLCLCFGTFSQYTYTVPFRLGQQACQAKERSRDRRRGKKLW